MFRLATRNIGRNPRRTLLTLLVISVGTFSMILTDAFVLGTQKNMIDLSTSLFAGQAQIHHANFKKLRESEYIVPNLKQVNKILADSKSVKAFTQRVIISGMISSSRDATMVQVFGVDFVQEPGVSKLRTSIVFGRYPNEQDERPIILGHKLAHQLGVEEGDKVVITTSEVDSGNLVQELFRVVARSNFHSRPIDSGFAFIPLDMAQNLLKIGSNVHEIAIRFQDVQQAVDPHLDIWQKLKEVDVLAEGWDKVFPSLKAMIEMNQYSIFIIGSILFALISLSILNTMFMSIYERMFEFGVIRSIGTRSRQLGSMIVMECLGIGLLGVMVGMVVGGAFVFWLKKNGISYAEFEMNGMSMVEPIKAVVRWQQFTLMPLSVMIMCLVASLYPAYHASRITPADAMRKSQ